MQTRVSLNFFNRNLLTSIELVHLGASNCIFKYKSKLCAPSCVIVKRSSSSSVDHTDIKAYGGLHTFFAIKGERFKI